MIVSFSVIYLLFVFFCSYSTITACPDNSTPFDVSDYFANLIINARCPSDILEGEHFRWIQQFHRLSVDRKKIFWDSNNKLNGNDVFMNKFLLRPLSDLMTDDLERVYKIFVGLSKDSKN